MPELRARAPQSVVDALQIIAEREGRKPTDVLRDLVIEKAKEYNLWPPIRFGGAFVDPEKRKVEA
jgi:hypothetical protein